MKNILKTLILLLALKMSGQQVVKSQDYYDNGNFQMDNVYFQDVDNMYPKFLGTWEGSYGPHYVKIIVTKKTKVRQGVTPTGKKIKKTVQYMDMITVDYQYKYNGVMIYNVMPPYQTVNGRLLNDVWVGHATTSTEFIRLSYNEPSSTACPRQRLGELKLTYVGGATPTLQWQRTDQQLNLPESLCTNGQFDNSAYQIPANLTLTKVN